MTARWVDNHCHLPGGEDGDAQVHAAQASGVARMIDVGTDLAHSEAAVASADRHPGVVFAAVGLHPHDAINGIDGLEELAADPCVVAIGECGLDYHYDHSPREVQREAFAAQIGLAHALELPLVIHTREAWDDTFAVLESESMPAHTVFHCFTGGPIEAERALALGAVLSFSGIVTFRGAPELREALLIAPVDRIMVETDSPYLTPEPHRGQKNRPALVPVVGQRMADVRGIDVCQLAEQLWDTTHAFYNLPPLP